MKKLVSLIAGAAALASLAPAAAAQSVGDWVLAPWQDSAHRFPGVVVARSGQGVTIRFDDGTTETRLARDVRPFNWHAGSLVECRYRDGQWYRATIRSMGNDGVTMQIRYDDDGIEERTSTGRCRTRA